MRIEKLILSAFPLLVSTLQNTQGVEGRKVFYPHMKVGILTVGLQYHFNKMKMTKCLENFFNPRVTGKVMGILWEFMLGETDNKFSKVIWTEKGGNNIQWLCSTEFCSFNFQATGNSTPEWRNGSLENELTFQDHTKLGNSESQSKYRKSKW